MDYTYGANMYGQYGQYNPDTNTIDYDPSNPPKPDEDDKKFRTVGVATIGIELRLPTGDVVKINPNDYVNDLVVELPDKTIKTRSGRLLAVCGSSRYQQFMPRCYNPRGPQLSDYILPQMLVIDGSEAHTSKLYYIPIFSILRCGEIISAEEMGVTIIGPGPQYADPATVIEGLPAGSVVELLSGEYNEPLVLSKSITIRARGEVRLGGAISVDMPEGAEKVDVVFDGIDFVGDASITVNHATGFKLNNCVFKEATPTETQSVSVSLTNPDPCYVEITNNTFANQTADDGKCFRESCIVINSNLVEHSKINNNRFEEGCCTGNTIELYGLERNGDVEVSKNYAYRSANLVKIAFRGSVNGRIELRENAYDHTDSDAEFGGLVVVQPVNTITFGMLDISISDTNNGSGVEQLIYCQRHHDDMEFNSGTKPRVYIDGYLFDPKVIELDPSNESNGTSGIDLSNIVEGDPDDITNPTEGQLIFDDIDG